MENEINIEYTEKYTTVHGNRHIVLYLIRWINYEMTDGI